ncbi:LysE family translocator [Pseudomonas sp. RP23018S]|uniref:LysE family translocator n=1 Tax=Pseudomonas sp. RP23018S TaxID=3096037 RepID=UPI002ACAF907|nr:LysE family translocator [Pseudomonas sp. RP23018S]MDZ5605140.1 LysE family translocator [Pseudomonas sp. RP23018S]
MTLFALGMSLSPGPVNLLILACGVQHGFGPSLSLVFGATVGFTLLLILTGAGLSSVLACHPLLLQVLALAGAGFIGYLGYTLATCAPTQATPSQARPRFMQGFWLQWLNPKAWIACASGVALFASPEAAPDSLLAFVVIYFVVCYLSLAAWALLGAQAAGVLDSERRQRLFNLTLAALLIGTAAYMLYLQLRDFMPALGR